MEQSREGTLEELGEREIHVGDFFDDANREYLRHSEKIEITLNEESELIPSVNLESSELEYSSAGDANVFFTSTPRTDSPPDIFINGLPVLSFSANPVSYTHLTLPTIYSV